MSLGILLVEDEAVQALGLRQNLEELGHRVLGLASDGRQACRLRQELQPDLVLMDIGLPLMDGIEAARVMNLERPLPVVLITGLADRRFIERAQQAQVYSYLLKPVEKEALGPALELAYQNFVREDQLRREVVDLRQDLRVRKLLARAVGLLMDRHQLGEAQAKDLLERLAREQGLKLIQAAQALLDAQDEPKPRRAG